MARPTTRPTLLIAGIVLAFGVLLGCAVGCGELLALAERPNGSTAFDSSITSWVVAHRADGLTTLAKVLSTLGSQAVLIPVSAIVAVSLLVRRRFVPALLLAAAWAGAIGLYNITKDIVGRPRPPAHLWLTNVRGSSSFPSGHATQSLATFVAIALVSTVWIHGVRRPLLILALVLAVGVGWSRVYLGVHWATDVVAGWVIAAAWVAILVQLVRRSESPAEIPSSERNDE